MTLGRRGVPGSGVIPAEGWCPECEGPMQAVVGHGPCTGWFAQEKHAHRRSLCYP